MPLSASRPHALLPDRTVANRQRFRQSTSAACHLPAARALARATLFAALFALAACTGTPPRPASETPGAATAPPSPSSTPSTEPAPGTTAPTASEAKPATSADNATVKVPEENRIYFASGASRIDAEGLRKLRQHGARLKEDAKLVVTLVGHTDHLGSRSYNIAIAEQRTMAVASQLLAAGARRTQIRRYSMGNEKDAGSCRTATCRQQMRRVDLIYEE